MADKFEKKLLEDLTRAQKAFEAIGIKTRLSSGFAGEIKSTRDTREASLSLELPEVAHHADIVVRITHSSERIRVSLVGNILSKQIEDAGEYETEITARAVHEAVEFALLEYYRVIESAIRTTPAY